MELTTTDVLLSCITGLLAIIAWFMSRMVRQFDRLEVDVRDIQKSFVSFRNNVASALNMEWLRGEEGIPASVPQRHRRR